MTNKSRLRLLHAREQSLQNLFQTARTQILSLASDSPDQYVQFLEGVIVQGLLQLLEPNVTVYAREKDLEVVQQAVDAAKQRYGEISGREVEVEVEGGLDDDL